MSTEIYTECESLSLSNMMFRRVLHFASNFARERTTAPLELAWIDKFAQLEEKSSLAVHIEEVFTSADEVKFWTDSLFNCAQAIYNREIEDQDNQEWQVSTIWAMYEVARMLSTEYGRRVYKMADVPSWEQAYEKRLRRINRKLSRTLKEMDEVLEQRSIQLRQNKTA